MFSSRIRRNRERLACVECRRRKLRCDRESPCGSCVRRGDAPSCSYLASASGLEHERDLRIQAEERLAHLEQLVHQLAARNANNSARNVAPGLASSTTVTAIPMDRSHAANGPQPNPDLEDPAYIGASHWSAMLDDIQALRSAVNSNDTDDNAIEPGSHGQATTCIGILFGVHVSPISNIENILQQHLPSRQEADRLISNYFWRTAVTASFIHAQQFRRQYEAFWSSPGTAPVLWTSILFSIFHIATKALRQTDDSFVVGNNQFSVAAARCLILGEYFRPRRFAVEALLIYVQSYCLTSIEVSPDIGPISSVLIRLATRMGYHRDPAPLVLSPFEKEMRRRTWSLCMQLDLLIAFHLGLPSSIQYPTWDTLPPSILSDLEFHEDMVSLPTPLPRTEWSGMPFYIAKHHLMVVFEKIVQHALTVRQDVVVDGEVESLDAELRRVSATLPTILGRQPITECFVESRELIVALLFVSFLYNKCLCVLHRPYITKGRAESVTECYTAASAIVQDFVDAQKECKAGGVLEGERWFMTSITWHDFLLGVTTLCMVICATSQGLTSPCTNQPAMMKLLERAKVACLEREGGMNKDTARVLSVIKATIRMFGEQDVVEVEGHNLLAGDEALGPDGPADGAPATVEADWRWTDNVAGPFDDPNWAYLDRFLGLPDYDA